MIAQSLSVPIARGAKTYKHAGIPLEEISRLSGENKSCLNALTLSKVVHSVKTHLSPINFLVGYVSSGGLQM